MNGLCRDCDCDSIRSDGDNTWIGRQLICSFHQKYNITGKTKDELEEYSSLPIMNVLNQLSFMWCYSCWNNTWCVTGSMSIYFWRYGTFLHSFCYYFDISYCCLYIQRSRRQNERGMPALGEFSHGLMSIKFLETKEIFSWM